MGVPVGLGQNKGEEISRMYGQSPVSPLAWKRCPQFPQPTQKCPLSRPSCDLPDIAGLLWLGTKPQRTHRTSPSKSPFIIGYFMRHSLYATSSHSSQSLHSQGTPYTTQGGCPCCRHDSYIPGSGKVGAEQKQYLPLSQPPPGSLPI